MKTHAPIPDLSSSLVTTARSRARALNLTLREYSERLIKDDVQGTSTLYERADRYTKTLEQEARTALSEYAKGERAGYHSAKALISALNE